MLKSVAFTTTLLIILSCSKSTLEKYNGVNLKTTSNKKEHESDKYVITKPGRVLKTFYKTHRIIPVFKIDVDEKDNEEYSATSYFHTSWYPYDSLNAWHNHFMPGIAAISGYNMTNVADFNTTNSKRTDFFDKNVLINTIYYPATIGDTLNGKPIERNYYLVSAYDEDTNNDSIINAKDLRRFYHFDLNAKKKTSLIPKEYSVLSSQYDYLNDFMYIKAKKDMNGNGARETSEPTHIFWIDMKNPKPAKRAY